MFADIEMVIKYILYPLVTAFVAVIVFLYRNDIKDIKERLKAEKQDRVDDHSDNQEDISRIFQSIDQVNRTLASIETKMDVQEKICSIRHSFPPWNGEERRKAF